MTYAKNTTAKQLQTAIHNNMVSITEAKLISKEDFSEHNIAAEQFMEDLAFYIESGIFKDSVDFTYTFSEENLIVSIGGKSSHCNQIIKVTLQMEEGITREILEKAIKKVEE